MVNRRRLPSTAGAASSLAALAAAAVLLAAAPAPASAVTCLDDSGNSVSWSFTYKLPNSYSVAYVDSRTRRASGILEVSSQDLNDSSNPQALIRTLRSLVTTRDGGEFSVKTPFLLYNDQPDNAQPGSNYGHTKGIIAADSEGGIWISHSTPSFPSSDDMPKFFFPESEIKFGQTFLCVTVDKTDLNKIAGQFLYTTPYVYHSEFDSSIGDDYPNLAKVLAKEWIDEGSTNTATFSAGSTHFTHYAKNGAWDSDIYGDLVAPALKTDLLVESWIRGSALGSYCRPDYKYDVTDVNNMVALDASGANITWKETQDHAKWCITAQGSGSNHLCVCDINRMSTQRKRGGGCTCFEDTQLASILENSIVDHDSCKSRR